MSQQFSLHPAWDRMYLSGMTVREIAEFVDAPRSTVQRHLQVQASLRDDLRPVHEAANEARGPGWPGIGWQHRYAETQDFMRRHGRLPRTDGDDTETHLSKWLAAQRSEHHRGILSDTKTALMDVLDGWEASPRQQELDVHWRLRLGELVAFVAEARRMPHWKRYDTDHEHTLGVWLHTQHQARSEDTLLPWRHAALNQAVPGWHSSM